MGVTVSVNRRGIQQVLHGEGPGGHVHNYVRRLGRQGAKLARTNAPRGKTGDLKASIDHTVIYDGPRVVRIDFGTYGVRYGMWVEKGTGIYGPRRRRITRPGGGLMAFTGAPRKFGPTRSGRLRPRLQRRIVVRSTRGQVAQHYLRNALIELAALHPELGIRILR